jgi:hypothetical protein
MFLKQWMMPCLIVAAIGVASPVQAVTLGQIDDFEDGTTENWTNGGSGAPPVVNVATGGPAGANDNFAEVTADGIGAGQRLTTFNRTQWLGDYVAAGVTAIEMDLLNEGATELTIRLAFKNGTGNGAPTYVTEGFTLAVGSGWQHAVFSLQPADLTPVDHGVTTIPYGHFFRPRLPRCGSSTPWAIRIRMATSLSDSWAWITWQRFLSLRPRHFLRSAYAPSHSVVGSAE